MTKRSRKIILVVALLALGFAQALPVNANSAAPNALAASYRPGVRVGDWWQSSITLNCLSLCPPSLSQFNGIDSINSTVADVTGASVLLNNTVHYSNGTKATSQQTENIETGQPGFMYYILAANLTTGNAVYNVTGSLAINSVHLAQLLGASRNVTQAVQSGSYYGIQYTMFATWDQLTGILASATISVLGGVVVPPSSITLISTNIWRPTPGFSLSVFPFSLILPSDGTRYIVYIILNSINGFSGSVAITAISNGTGLTAELGQTSATVQPGLTAYANLTLSSHSVGVYSVNVTAVGSSVSHSALVEVQVLKPSIGTYTVAPTEYSVSTRPGNTTLVDFSVKSVDNFNGPVSLNPQVFDSNGHIVTNDPFGVRVSLDNYQLSMNMNQTTAVILTIETPNLPIQGNYTVKVDAHGGLPEFDRYLNVTVKILSPDFTITLNPRSMSGTSGVTGNARVVVRGYGFFGAVDLSLSSSPPGLSCNLNETSLSVGAGYGPVRNATLSCQGRAGSYTVTITGNGGGLTHSTTMLVVIAASSSRPVENQGFTLFGLPLVESYGIVAGIVAVLAIAAIGGYWWRRGPTASKATVW